MAAIYGKDRPLARRRNHAAAVIFLLSPALTFLNTRTARRLAPLAGPLGALAGTVVARRLRRRSRR